MRIEIIQDAFALARLEKVWNPLLAHSSFDSVFLTYEWFSTFIKSFNMSEHLAIIVVYVENQAVGILPLYRDHFNIMGVRFNSLRSITNAHTPQYAFIIKTGFEKYLHKALLLSRDYLRWDLLQLDYVSEGSHLINQFLLGKHQGLNIETVPGMKSPYILINSDWMSYYDLRPKSVRKEIAYKERRTSRDYSVEVEHINNDRLKSVVLEEAFIIEDSGWKGRNKSSILKNERVKKFYHDLAFEMNRNGWFELLFLTFSGKRIAFRYWLPYRSVCSSLKIGYDESFAKYSPGIMLEKLSVEYLFAEGYDKCDMSGQADKYKLVWANGIDRLYSLYIFSAEFKSKILKFILFDIKKLADRMGIKDQLKWIYCKLRGLREEKK